MTRAPETMSPDDPAYDNYCGLPGCLCDARRTRTPAELAELEAAAREAARPSPQQIIAVLDDLAAHTGKPPAEITRADLTDYYDARVRPWAEAEAARLAMWTETSAIVLRHEDLADTAPTVDAFLAGIPVADAQRIRELDAQSHVLRSLIGLPA